MYPVVDPEAMTEIVASQPDEVLITLVVAAAISLVLVLP